MVKCDNCGRTFNQHAAERHIPKCKNIFNKAKAPPTRAELEQKKQERKNMYGSPTRNKQLRTAQGASDMNQSFTLGLKPIDSISYDQNVSTTIQTPSKVNQSMNSSIHNSTRRSVTNLGYNQPQDRNMVAVSPTKTPGLRPSLQRMRDRKSEATKKKEEFWKSILQDGATEANMQRPPTGFKDIDGEEP